MKVYLAAPIFTPQQIEIVEMMKKEAEGGGHEVFSPYHNSQDIFNGRKPQECTEQERAKVLDDNIINLDWCDVLFAWVGGMGGFTDPGVIWEMGYAYAKGKFIAAYVDPEVDAERRSMNLMLAGTVSAAIVTRNDITYFFGWLPIEEYTPFKTAMEHYPTTVFDKDKEPIV